MFKKIVGPFLFFCAVLCSADEIRVNTSNPGKLAEYKEYFFPDEIVALSVDLREPQADLLTIIQYKASQFDGVLVDDVSLDIEGMEVGVNIRWIIKDLNSEKYFGRHCTYTCLIALKEGDHVCVYCGSVAGQLVKPRGDCFGFGRYFLPDGTNLTLGEFMDPCYNARYIAIQNFKEDKPFAILPVLKEWNGAFQN